MLDRAMTEARLLSCPGRYSFRHGAMGAIRRAINLIIALGGERSFGATMATVMRVAASEVEEGVVPDSGHWIMEENPKATIALVRAFLDKG